MKRVPLICSLMILCAISSSAQKTKPWTEWTAKDAEKVMNDSAWAQTQTETAETEPKDTNAITQVEAQRNAERNLSRTGESGESKQPISMYFRIRFLSAKPVRAAFVRIVELKGASPEQLAVWRPFIDRDFSNYVVITITIDGTDRSRIGPAMQSLTSATLETLKSNTYLERKDGKRLALMDYRAPQDALGAKFVFPRTLDGKPFIDTDGGEIRFNTELGKDFKINRRFKVSEMLYEGKLEY